jgi:transcriptional regulator with XRE-family HTH domain
VLIPSQIRGLRLRRSLKQEELGREAEMKQSRISAMERPGETQFNVDTLIRLAAALRVALRVEFVPFSGMLAWENGFSQDTFNVTRLDDDRAFLEPEIVAASKQQTAHGAEQKTASVGQKTHASAYPLGSSATPTVESRLAVGYGRGQRSVGAAAGALLGQERMTELKNAAISRVAC